MSPRVRLTAKAALPLETATIETQLPDPEPVALGSAEDALPTAQREVLGFDARLLLHLPLPATLLVSTHEGERCAFRAASAAPNAEAALAFVGPEWFAVVLAAEHDRANAVVLASWCTKKREQPAWRLTQTEAIGGLGHRTPERGWTVERVLGALGARLEEVLV